LISTQGNIILDQNIISQSSESEQIAIRQILGLFIGSEILLMQNILCQFILNIIRIHGSENIKAIQCLIGLIINFHETHRQSILDPCMRLSCYYSQQDLINLINSDNGVARLKLLDYLTRDTKPGEKLFEHVMQLPQDLCLKILDLLNKSQPYASELAVGIASWLEKYESYTELEEIISMSEKELKQTELLQEILKLESLSDVFNMRKRINAIKALKFGEEKIFAAGLPEIEINRLCEEVKDREICEIAQKHDLKKEEVEKLYDKIKKISEENIGVFSKFMEQLVELQEDFSGSQPEVMQRIAFNLSDQKLIKAIRLFADSGPQKLLSEIAEESGATLEEIKALNAKIKSELQIFNEIMKLKISYRKILQIKDALQTFAELACCYKPRALLLLFNDLNMYRLCLLRLLVVKSNARNLIIESDAPSLMIESDARSLFARVQNLSEDFCRKTLEPCEKTPESRECMLEIFINMMPNDYRALNAIYKLPEKIQEFIFRYVLNDGEDGLENFRSFFEIEDIYEKLDCMKEWSPYVLNMVESMCRRGSYNFWQLVVNLPVGADMLKVIEMILKIIYQNLNLTPELISYIDAMLAAFSDEFKEDAYKIILYVCTRHNSSDKVFRELYYRFDASSVPFKKPQRQELEFRLEKPVAFDQRVCSYMIFRNNFLDKFVIDVGCFETEERNRIFEWFTKDPIYRQALNESYQEWFGGFFGWFVWLFDFLFGMSRNSFWRNQFIEQVLSKHPARLIVEYLLNKNGIMMPESLSDKQCNDIYKLLEIFDGKMLIERINPIVNYLTRTNENLDLNMLYTGVQTSRVIVEYLLKQNKIKMPESLSDEQCITICKVLEEFDEQTQIDQITLIINCLNSPNGKLEFVPVQNESDESHESHDNLDLNTLYEGFRKELKNLTDLWRLILINNVFIQKDNKIEKIFEAISKRKDLGEINVCSLLACFNGLNKNQTEKLYEIIISGYVSLGNVHCLIHSLGDKQLNACIDVLYDYTCEQRDYRLETDIHESKNAMREYEESRERLYNAYRESLPLVGGDVISQIETQLSFNSKIWQEKIDELDQIEIHSERELEELKTQADEAKRSYLEETEVNNYLTKLIKTQQMLYAAKRSVDCLYETSASQMELSHTLGEKPESLSKIRYMIIRNKLYDLRGRIEDTETTSLAELDQLNESCATILNVANRYAAEERCKISELENKAEELREKIRIIDAKIDELRQQADEASDKAKCIIKILHKFKSEQYSAIKVLEIADDIMKLCRLVVEEEDGSETSNSCGYIVTQLFDFIDMMILKSDKIQDELIPPRNLEKFAKMVDEYIRNFNWFENLRIDNQLISKVSEAYNAKGAIGATEFCDQQVCETKGFFSKSLQKILKKQTVPTVKWFCAYLIALRDEMLKCTQSLNQCFSDNMQLAKSQIGECLGVDNIDIYDYNNLCEYGDQNIGEYSQLQCKIDGKIAEEISKKQPLEECLNKFYELQDRFNQRNKAPGGIIPMKSSLRKFRPENISPFIQKRILELDQNKPELGYTFFPELKSSKSKKLKNKHVLKSSKSKKLKNKPACNSKLRAFSRYIQKHIFKSPLNGLNESDEPKLGIERLGVEEIEEVEERVALPEPYHANDDTARCE